MKKMIYKFGGGSAEGNSSMKELLGGKGANLAEMSNIGVPVPPGFTIPTELCRYYYSNNLELPKNFSESIKEGLNFISSISNMKFGDKNNPLLISVRSGAAFSMPGMMDTILNLGLNDDTVEGLIKLTNNPRFVYDSYRRFIQMFSDVVLDVHSHYFEDFLESVKMQKSTHLDSDLDAQDMKYIVEKYKQVVKDHTGKPFPQNVYDQLDMAIMAVLKSWMSHRAITYRKINNIPEILGTAVNIQSMVFGNMGDDSVTGVCFTRDPSNGENYLYGEYLVNAQGEDVVAGIRTPQQITNYGKKANCSDLVSMQESMPGLYKELLDICSKLELHYKDVQDIEFTVQKGKLWILQTRNAKRSASAAIKIAVDFVKENLITKEEALLRINPESLNQLLHPSLDSSAKYNVMAKGLPASPGAVSGMIVFSADEAEQKSKLGLKVILTRSETSPEDIHGMIASEGILTNRGGMTSHAAVVARGMGKTCICGASTIHIDSKNKIMKIGDIILSEGDIITLNGNSGEVILGEVSTQKPEFSAEFQTIMSWADDVRKLDVRTNAETVADVSSALYFGAEGIGLCRTEHMFFHTDRINVMRQMILSDNLLGRKSALEKLLPMQTEDFYNIFKLMKSLPVTIRLLDPPLHEFLPNKDEEYEHISKLSGISIEYIKQRTLLLHESNPMLGHRGCRLGISYPEIYEMQVKAIINAAIAVYKEFGYKVVPEIMVPLIMNSKELEIISGLINNTAKKMLLESLGSEDAIDYKIGTMIELPRAALRAYDLAKHAEFFSFGTNDLTQTTMGISRDDIGSFLGHYKDSGIFMSDPFEVLDQEGVGELIKIASERGKARNQNIKLGVCGEHAGNPATILFCHSIGLDYISCSPYRIPVAKLAAAQAVCYEKVSNKEVASQV